MAMLKFSLSCSHSSALSLFKFIRFKCALRLFVILLLVLFLTSQPSIAKLISAPLEIRPPRAMVPGSARGFHRFVVLHNPLPVPKNQLHALIRRLFVSRNHETTKYHRVDLYGGMVAVGEYYARVKIGGQTLRVQIDTGSATLAAPLKQCTNCKRGDMRYAVEDSTSGIAHYVSCDHDECQKGTCGYGCGKCSSIQACCAKSNSSNCAFHLNFGDGSGAKGMLVRDEFEWGDIKFPVTFGGIASDSPDFERKEVDGILGMAYRSLACNPSCVQPTFDAMLKQEEKNGMKDLFAICITYDSGRMVLGDYDPTLSTKSISWVRLHLSQPPTFYSFPLQGDLQVNGKSLSLPEYSRAIVDSGTTLIVFSTSTFNAFKSHLLKHYCDVPGLCPSGDNESWFQAAHCTRLRSEDYKKMPTLTFKLEGFDVVMEPSDYLINYASKGPDLWCVGIMALDAMSGGVDVILGNTVMKKYVTIYDRENSRVGFAESDTKCGVNTHSDSSVSNPNDSDDNERGGKGDNIDGQGTNGDDDNEKSTTACAAATNCTSCLSVQGTSCKWDASNKNCVPGTALKWMCKLEELESNVAYIVGGSVAAVLAAIVVVAVVVHTYRKRRDALSVDESEKNELEQPLAPNGGRGNDDNRAAFSIEGDDDHI